jgi:Spy/CpxP family protein refolding chaperone
MNVYRLIAAVAAATFLIAAGAAQAEDQPDGMTGASERPHHRGFNRSRGPGGPGAMSGQMLLRMADELNLSIEQQDTLQDLMDEFQPSWDSLRERASASRSKMMGLTPDDPEYRSVTEEVRQQAAALAAEMVMLRSDFEVRAYALLTEEQHQRLEELKSERRHYRRSWGPGDSA